MSKIGEMRKVDVELKKLKELAARKLTFQARVGLSEEIALLRSQASSFMKEDMAVEAYGKKLLTEMDKFAEDVEDDDFGGGDEGAPPEDAGADIGGEEGAPPPGEGEAGPQVDKTAFDTVMKAVLSSLCPGAGEGVETGAPGEEVGAPGAEGGPPGGDMQGVIDSAYEEFNSTGTLDVDGLVAQLSGEGGEEEGGFNPEGPIESPKNLEGPPPTSGGPEMGSETKFESRELRAAVQLIARLRESARNGEGYRAKIDELAERLKAHHPYLKELEEARPKLKAANENAARLERNRALLGRAKTEIDRLKESLDEEKQVSEALVRLLKEHGIKDASKLIEDTRAEAAKKTAEASTVKDIEKALGEDNAVTGGSKGGKEGSAVGPGECEVVKDSSGSVTGDAPGEDLEDGKGETATKVGGQDQKGREGGDGGGHCNVATSASTTSHYSAGKSESKARNRIEKAKNGENEVLEESKKEEEHDLLRYVRRQRSNPYEQL
jgi:hypothetical protein